MVSRWKENLFGRCRKSCVHDLSNEENENNFAEEPVVEGPTERVNLDAARAVNEGMKNRKASGSSSTTSGLFKYAGETGAAELDKIFLRIFDSAECPAERSKNLNGSHIEGKR